MRKATKARIADIKCPFFRGHTHLEIGCEGITSETNLRLIFSAKVKLLQHEQIFCCEHYQNCELYEAIIKQYEE